MDYYVNSKTEEKTIYEIYKACRLCGAGAGYKMPIIQNVVNISTDEIELKQKIRECVQIEVHQDDKMPPLICELCVDKVNDFYEFMDMCKQTNKKTRLRLGLPPQTLPSGAPDAGDCILGVTEPVYINDNSNEAILTRRSKSAKNSKTKKEQEEVKVESKLRRRDEPKPSNVLNTSTRSGRSREATPPRSLRGTKRQSDDDISLSRLQKTRRPDAQGLKSILKKNTPENEPRHKRSRDSISRERNKSEANKRVKISLNNHKKSSKPEPKSSKTTSTRSAPPSYKCHKCKISFSRPQALSNHMRAHPSPKVHKREPSPPPPRAEAKHKTRWCFKCKKNFPTNTFKTHKCTNRTWSCGNCKRQFQTSQALTSHERYCKTSREVRLPRKWTSMVRPLQVRISKCDSLLDDRRCCDVSAVPHDFGLDKDCIYPYLNMSVRKLRIKSELAAYDSMVNIQDEIRDEFSYVHWDSESEADSDIDSYASDTHLKTHNVKSLFTLSLRVIYSPKMLGKVPRKLRKIKSEKPFDSILNVTEIDSDMKLGIDSIIDSLEDKSDNISKTVEDDFLFNENKGPGVKNSDFDSIFHNEISEENSNSTISITTTEKLDVKKNSINKDESCNNGANGETNGNNILDHDSILSRESVNINEYDSTSSKIDIENNMIECYKSSETNNSDISENCENNTTNSIVTKEIKDTKSNENDELEEECVTRECSEDIIENKLNTETDIIESPVKEAVADEAKEDKENSIETNLIKENDVKTDEKDEEQVLDFKNHNSEILDDSKNTNNESVNLKLECKDGQESIETKIVENDEDAKNENIKTFEASKANGDLEAVDKFNMDDLEDLSDTDMDDKKLMEALDAQIGESDTKSTDATGTETNI